MIQVTNEIAFFYLMGVAAYLAHANTTALYFHTLDDKKTGCTSSVCKLYTLHYLYLILAFAFIVIWYFFDAGEITFEITKWDNDEAAFSAFIVLEMFLLISACNLIFVAATETLSSPQDDKPNRPLKQSIHQFNIPTSSS